MVKELFGSFIKNFSYMFEDDDFESGQEFISDFITSLKCRIYQAWSYIVQESEKLSDLFLIYKGHVCIAVNQEVFLVLPTHSYFGDYQIILNIRSQF